MSSEAIGWVFKFSPYRGAALAVHLAIADSVNDVHEDRFWMTQSNLAAKARVTRGTVGSTIATMIDDGFVELLSDRHGAGEANEYRLIMPVDVEQVYGWVRAERARGARTADKGCALGAQGGARPARKERTQERTQDETQDDARVVLDLVVDQPRPFEQFDGFWKAYPRGDGKPAARRAWERAVRVAPPERIMQGLEAWLDYWRRRDQPEFVPWAQKWLNQQQWFAEPPVIRGGTQGLGPGSARVNDAWAGVESGRVHL